MMNRLIRILGLMALIHLAPVNLPGTAWAFDDLQKDLINAVKINAVKEVKGLLQDGAAVDAKDPEGHTPLHWACAGGFTETVDLLLKSGANINAKTYLDYSPLLYAIRFRRNGIARDLMEKGADVSARTAVGADPLLFACALGEKELVRDLLNKGADPLKLYRRKATLLLAVSGHGKPEVAEILTKAGVKVDQASESGRTPLMEAAYRGNHEMVEWLIKRGAEVNKPDKRGRTALHWAALTGYGPVVAELMKNGADREIEDHKGETPLQIALRRDHGKVAKALKSGNRTGLTGKAAGPWPQWLSHEEKENPQDDSGHWDVKILEKGAKVAQLTNEYDRARGTFTNNRTLSRRMLKATDLGAAFEHDGKTYLLFGDTGGAQGGDAIGVTEDKDPSDGIDLDFIPLSSGVYSPVDIPGISQGAFEVPMEGISSNGRMYIYHTTDRTRNLEMGRSVVAVSDDNGKSFTYLYDLSHRFFINVSVVKISSSQWEGLPRDSGEALLLFGSGRYRKSNVRLAFQPLDSIGDPGSIVYYSGMDNHGRPLWSKDEQAAQELFGYPHVGELSVSYNKFINRWIMLYNCHVERRGIHIRTAKLPWGPWSRPELLFDPHGEDGFCRILHRNIDKGRCDTLEDPGRAVHNGDCYGPYQYKNMAEGEEGLTTIYFNMSTWNPYTVVLMRAKLRVGP